MYVSDLFDRHGNPLQFNAFKNKFNLGSFPFTFFTGLINCIPNNWRAELNIIHDQPHLSFFEIALKHTSLSQFLYSYFIKLIVSPPTCITRWNAEIAINDSQWKNIFKAPFVSVREARIQYFQFRCVNRILGTNYLLYRMHLSSTPLCSFCNAADESIIHIFWECPLISSFILDVERAVFGRQFFFSRTDILFCYKFIAKHPFNFLIYYLKHYIFTKRTESESLCCNEFLYKFKFVLKVEKYISQSKTTKSKTNFEELKNAFGYCELLFI